MLLLYIFVHACLVTLPEQCKDSYLRVDMFESDPLIGREAKVLGCQMVAHSIVFTKWQEENPGWRPQSWSCGYFDPAKIPETI